MKTVFLSLLLTITSLTITSVAHAEGMFRTKVSTLHVDQNGWISFQTKSLIPAGISNGCAAANWFYIEGRKTSYVYTAMVNLLQAAVINDSDVELFTKGCHLQDNSAWMVRLYNKRP